MKFVRILIVALGLMMIAATSSFAVVPFFTSSTSNQMAPNAQTGLVGNVVLTPIAPGNIGPGEIINISYNPATITSLTDLRVTVKGVVFGPFAGFGVANAITIGTTTVTVNASNILISFAAAAPGEAFIVTDLIQVAGVRVNVSTFAAVNGVLNANISNVLGQAPVTNPLVQVANFVEPIAVITPTSFGLPNFSRISTAGTNVRNNPEFVSIVEAGAFTNAFETRGAAAPTKVKVRISNIPAGVTLAAAIDAAGLPAGYTQATAAIDASGVVQSGTTATITINITAQNANVLEAIPLRLTWGVAFGTATVPLGKATIAATLAPPINVFTEFPPLNVDVTGLRYAERFTAEQDVFEVVQLTTELLAVFNVFNSAFNTGFAVANTTGILQSTTQPGAIKVTLYPSDGSASKTFTTSATNKPGAGLDANGFLPAGATWTVLLSDLLGPAGVTGNFQGMVRFTTNFSNAHGINFIADSNFAVQAQGFPMLVLPPSPRAVGFESLGE